MDIAEIFAVQLIRYKLMVVQWMGRPILFFAYCWYRFSPRPYYALIVNHFLAARVP
ncbi:MAG TPA: hypothetical protein VIE65_18660 [Methylobacter sp.]